MARDAPLYPRVTRRRTCGTEDATLHRSGLRPELLARYPNVVAEFNASIWRSGAGRMGRVTFTGSRLPMR